MTMYPRVPANGKSSNIGPQFANVGTYVLAPGTDGPVLRGAIGELCASGKLVGRGYLNRPELTEKTFPTLAARFNHDRIYRTGDLVRALHDGSFDFAGRADDQVKLRGQRLEIGEINQVIKEAGEHAVQAVATLVLRHPKQQKDQLVSFFVVRSDPREQQPLPTTSPTAATATATTGEPTVIHTHSRKLMSKLAATCRSKLPAYMVPTHFLPISHMPLSINNKVDARALKALYQNTALDVLQQLARREEEDTAATATTGGNWTEVEKLLHSVLMDMTKLDSSEINRSSTIFELGLDSVSVVGLSRRLKKSGCAAVAAATPSLVMRNPQLSQLASALLIASTTATTPSIAVAGTEGVARLEAVRREIASFASRNSLFISQTLKLRTTTGEIERILPCTALQEGMIARFLDSHSESPSTPRPPLYFNAFPMVLHPSTDEHKLRSAWDTVVESTDVLRTCFCETPDGYAQVVLNKTQAPILWEEFEIVTEKEEEEGAGQGGLQAEVGRELARAVTRNKDLHVPPLSLVLIRTLAGKRVLSLNIFHALYDGNSLPLILRDVRCAYAGIQYHPRPLQFPDVTAHLLSCADLGPKAQAFWEANVKPPTDPMPLQFDQHHHSPEEAREGDYAEELQLAIEGATLDKLCRRLQCTPQAVFLAAWVSVLGLHGNNSNSSGGGSGPVVTLGLVVSGRSLPIDDIEGVIGPTFNTIPASFDLGHAGAAPSWETLVKAIHKFNSESLAFHHTPLRLIHKWLQRTSEQPLIESLFAYQKDPATDGHDHDGGDGSGGGGLWEMMHPGSMVPVVADVSCTSHFQKSCREPSDIFNSTP